MDTQQDLRESLFDFPVLRKLPRSSIIATEIRRRRARCIR